MLAKKKITEYCDNRGSVDVVNLMTALDGARTPSEQDWDNETTTWEFENGSKIRVTGIETEVFDTMPNTGEVGWYFAGWMGG